jgi:class 3 adenylate cyclase
VKICAACGERNPDKAKFCLECGGPLAEPPPRQEERKVVTVVFADLVGFTSRSERMDVEDVRGTLQPYHQLLRRELERHGGTVEKFIGDAVMALFGAPVAHEDDAERAVRAALAIQDAVAQLRERDERLDLHVRIGVNTGEALVALGANPQAGEGMASGDVVNTAARLQSAAPVDGVLVGEVTYRATSRAIEYEGADPVEAKGKSAPVGVWVARQPRSRLGSDVQQAPTTPLVGRERQLALLWSAFAQAREERSPQLVTLLGVPGIGKSRLVWELFRQVEDDPEQVTWRQGRSLPYGEGVAFWALGEIVKAQAGVLHSDSAEASGEKLHQAVTVLIPTEREAAWVDGHLRPLLGLESEDEVAGDRRSEAFAAWRRFVEALAERGPAVLVFEDLHWADDALLDFIEHLVEWASGVPLLILGTARPELLERRTSFGSGTANALRIALASLSEADTARLVAALLQQAVLPAGTQGALIERAEGNPLYAEEYVRMLIDRGVLARDGGRWRVREGEEVPLPESVQAIIAARLDALSADEKRLLQAASVLGKVAWLGAVEQIADVSRAQGQELLHRLERKEFVRRERHSSVEGETEYAFRHILVRDVAYGQIPRAARAAKHERAAQWIESLAGDRGDRIEMLAHHYLTARSLSLAVGRPTDTHLDERVARALWDAGRRAFSLGALAAAAEHYSQALRIDGLGAHEQALLQLDYGRAASLAHGAGEQALEAAAQVFEAEGDGASLAQTEAVLGELAVERGDGGAADAHFARAHAIAIELGPSEAKARVLTGMATRIFVSGDNDTAVPLARDAVRAATELGHDELRGKALAVLGTAKMHSVRGAGGDGVPQLEEAIALLRRIDSPQLFSACGYLSVIVSEAGDLRRDRELLREGSAIELRFGIPRMRERILSWEIDHHYYDGAWDDALTKVSTITGNYERAALCAVTARINYARGERGQAMDEAERLLSFARASGDAQVLLPALALGARLRMLTGGNVEGMLADLSRLWATVWNLSTFQLGADLAYLLASVRIGRRLLADASRPPGGSLWLDAACHVLEGDHSAAAAIYCRIGSHADQAVAGLHAGRRLIDEGARSEGEAELGKALSFWRRARATAYVRECEALLARAASA